LTIYEKTNNYNFYINFYSFELLKQQASSARVRRRKAIYIICRCTKKTKKKDYVDAAFIFEDIERQYPYSSWAGQAQLMACILLS